MKSSSKHRSPWRDCLISGVGLCGSYAAWSLWFVNGGWHRYQHVGEVILWAVSIFVGFWAAIDAIRFGRDLSPVKVLAAFFCILHTLLLFLVFLGLLLHGGQPR